MQFVVVLSMILATAFAATTKHPHHHHTGPTKEPIEHESFAFRYDPHSHMIAALVNHKCYVMALSGDQLTSVHTAHGLHTIEMSIITMIDDTTQTYTSMTQDELTAMSKVLHHSCQHARMVYKLN